MAAVESTSSPFSETSASPFPWDEVMRAGLGLLRLSPKNFWAMTPREFAAALGPSRRLQSAPSRAALDALMHIYPDR
ncbi:rcc01693 family protein [Falsochrobactrum ovis]|uniref:rcc01693 family protein n=1 Tax=Falsochrobactrum ovis TaxID=1293442 RepID=UPI0024794D5F|nr:rcc01693 family protein [Falsochrobactrum ovis]